MAFLKTAVFQLLMFAQGGEPAGADGTGEAAPQGNPLQLVVMLAVGGIMFYLMMIRPQQREQKERKKKLESLKKNDKVLTVGGIIGTIVDFSPDGLRVTLRVDDATRIKFVRSSIQGLYDEKSEAESTDK
jgi:preprotein translocase subunit YajC